MSLPSFVDEAADLLLAGRWEELADLLAPDATVADRRRAAPCPHPEPRAAVDAVRAWCEAGPLEFEIDEPVCDGADRALVRLAAIVGGGHVIAAALVVRRCGDRIGRVEIFDADDDAAAEAALSRLRDR